MIAKLSGTIAHLDLKYLVLDTGPVGYKVFINSDIFIKVDKNRSQNLTLWTYLAVRENALDLYGFPTLADLNFFELLITISGIGPKTAMGILNVANVQTIETAVQTGDTSHLTKISGIGKKVAEKIVMELKDKVSTIAHTPEHRETMKNAADALEALKSLGYTHNEARDALKELDKKITKTSDKVKEALKILGK